MESDACPWCQAQDSQQHRHWECTQFQRYRDDLDPRFWAQFDRAPLCTTEHGWLQEVPSLSEYRAILVKQPPSSHRFLAPPEENVLHFFTDGGAITPKEPRSRLGAWALVVANLEQDTFRPIGWGVLEGLIQTVIRAEATAAIAALRAGLQADVEFCIWTDNQLVRNRLETARGDKHLRLAWHQIMISGRASSP